MRSLLVPAALVAWTVISIPASASEPVPWRVLDPGERPDDARLGELRKLRDEYHPWQPPETKEEWERERERLRKQVLVSTGLWPMPPKTPLEPVIHGKIDRGRYTIEKVFFASRPGHYVTGNLYRPADVEGKVPGILCPHGHWADGRFYDAGEAKARQQIDKGAETTMAGARFPVQARMVQLAKLGCVVFHYDMVGYADSQPIAHREGFTDVEAGLRLQNVMGLQTWNSIRALDFLLSLPDVDPERIGVTGASGGGTQTFMLCAVDPRPDVAFPAVMVSTGMQGGCVCENASYLRLGINNIALAALFAPKPMAMSGADDWTVEIETKGLPELKRVYSFYGKADHVHAKAWPQFKHNYNQVARELMYNWFNRHLGLGAEGRVEEEDFWPANPPAEMLTVFDEEHPLPEDAKSAEELRDHWTEVAEEQFQHLLPESPEEMDRYREVVGTAARVMLDDGVPAERAVDITETSVSLTDSLTLRKGTVGRKSAGEQIPYVALIPGHCKGTLVLWFDDRGKSHLFGKDGRPTAAVQRLLDAGMIVASADLFLTGEFLEPGGDPQYPKVDETYHGYTFGYNRPVLSNRVRDILTLLGAPADGREQVERTCLVGTGQAGPWVLLAAGLARDRVDRTLVDLNGFSFRDVDSTSDPMFLPGALKYGGIGGLGGLAAPGRLTVAGTKEAARQELAPLAKVYRAAGAELTLRDVAFRSEQIADLLLAQ